MLDPGEPLLLSRRDDPTILNQRRGAVVIERGNTKNPHVDDQNSE